jgi:intracellular sulfur oxidation DsrE/DsrF family protein
MNICKSNEVGDELLNAFVDDELDAAEKFRLLDCMSSDTGAQLRERVSQIWQVRELVRSACPQHKTSTPAKTKILPVKWSSLIGSLILFSAIAAGWFLQTKPHENDAAANILKSKVIIHLSSGENKLFNIALNETEALSLNKDSFGNPIQVELLVDGAGLNLLRANVSPYARRINNLNRDHGNIAFLACNNSIVKLQKTGAHVTLLPHVNVVPSARELIMARIHNGWAYLKV